MFCLLPSSTSTFYDLRVDRFTSKGYQPLITISVWYNVFLSRVKDSLKEASIGIDIN